MISIKYEPEGAELNIKVPDPVLFRTAVLPDSLREDEIKLSLAKLEFYKKNFAVSRTYLSGIKNIHYLHYIDTAIFRLFNNYELEDFEESFPVINNLKYFLKNNKEILKIHHIRSLNFLKIYSKLLKYRTGIKNEDAELIVKEFENLKNISGKKWLAEKLAEIKK